MDDVDDAARQHALPMSHDPAVFDIMAAEQGEIIGRLVAPLEKPLVAAKAGIHRIAHGVKDDRVGQAEMDHADIEVVAERLVHDALGACIERPDRLQTPDSTKMPGRRFVAAQAFAGTIAVMQWPYEGYHRDGSGDPLRRNEPPARHFRTLGSEYVKAIRPLNRRVERIVNKALGNCFNIGMIHLCLPNAVILHAVRDPVDTCLGGYKRLFQGGNETTYDLALLGRHYVEYRRVMAHWQRVLPGRVIDIVQEDLVRDPENQIRRLLAACGLPWDERCLRPHETARPVRTASLNQVRQPIHQGSVQRWRRYEKDLGSRRALGPYAPQDLDRTRS